MYEFIFLFDSHLTVEKKAGLCLGAKLNPSRSRLLQRFSPHNTRSPYLPKMSALGELISPIRQYRTDNRCIPSHYHLPGGKTLTDRMDSTVDRFEDETGDQATSIKATYQLTGSPQCTGLP